MRQLFLILLLVVVGGASYAYYVAELAPCRTPLHYRIGTFDAEFGFSKAEARAAIADAEAFWEDAVGEELFVYDANADFPIHFVYDARQEETDEAQALSEILTSRREVSEEVRVRYDELVAKYEARRSAYRAAAAKYEARLAAYNQEVAKWNDRGGAPEDVYRRLQEEQKEVESMRVSLRADADALNTLAGEINELGEQGNEIVEEYNEVVESYNETYAGHQEAFTQGDYQGDFINIYQFDSPEELRLVLAHELGHALSLGHVENDQSVLYYLMGEQTLADGPTAEDLAEYARVCETNPITQLVQKLTHTTHQ